jgi:hypothetical protein
MVVADGVEHTRLDDLRVDDAGLAQMPRDGFLDEEREASAGSNNLVVAVPVRRNRAIPPLLDTGDAGGVEQDAAPNDRRDRLDAERGHPLPTGLTLIGGEPALESPIARNGAAGPAPHPA